MRTYGKYLAADQHGHVRRRRQLNPQISQLRKGVDILVATPGRLLDHAQQGTLDLSKVEILVLDEADRMLDMGFIHDIKKVLCAAARPRSRACCSPRPLAMRSRRWPTACWTSRA